MKQFSPTKLNPLTLKNAFKDYRLIKIKLFDGIDFKKIPLSIFYIRIYP
ncbi:hypothetical protein HMPREF1398_01233 [Helicobacter pylori GAM117Ai]|nr:hypothetical protein HMPREF1398_01233 [Helicobacter pylori GAM117Ai]